MAAQAGLCLAWSETPEDTFCHVVAQIYMEQPSWLDYEKTVYPARYILGKVLYEPRHPKICLRGFRPGKTQTGLLNYRDKLEA